MPRGNVPITKRSDLSVPISPVQNDNTLDSLRNAILHSTEAPDPAFPFGIAADVAGAAVADDPDYFDVRGTYHQTKVPADIGLPADVTDALVLVETHKLRTNADGGAAFQIAYSKTAGEFQRAGDVAGGWGAWLNVSQGVLIGEVKMWPMAAAPSRHLLLQGQSLLRVDYAELFAAYGVVYGSVDGTHFTLPDFRGRVPVGAGAGAGLTNRALGASGGEETHLLTVPEIPAHRHTITPTAAHRGGSGLGAFSGPLTEGASETQDAGGGGAHNNMQPFLVVNWIVRAKP